ncbi:MAG: class I SAM-dependent methyltransferase [Thermodesulfobacteriota bacterium]
MASYDHDSRDLAKIYDRISEWQFEGGKRLVEKLDIQPGDRVLDLGCGTGRLTGWIADRVGPKGAVTGVDPLPERVAMARNNNGGVCFEVGSAESLDGFADKSFDAVCLNEVFHWISDKPRALEEIYRVLRPGGRVGLTSTPKELHWTATVPHICVTVLSNSPYMESLDYKSMTAMTGHLTTTEVVTLLTGRRFSMVDVGVARRDHCLPDGRAVFDFAESSSFGNLLGLVPEHLRDSLRADLVAAFEKKKQDGTIPLRQFSAVFVAERSN